MEQAVIVFKQCFVNLTFTCETFLGHSFNMDAIFLGMKLLHNEWGTVLNSVENFARIAHNFMAVN